jgi:putative peptidoglycan lipid II flippase
MAVALGCLGSTLAVVLFSYGALDGGTAPIGWTLMAFAPGLVLFTVHYLMLRGFYAREDTRTPFLVQLGVSGSNIAAAIALTRDAPTDQIATRLALAYGVAYLVGSVASTLVLSRRIGGLGDRTMFAFTARLVAACVASALVMLGLPVLLEQVGVASGDAGAALVVLVGAGGIGALTYLVVAPLLGLREVRALLAAVTRR